MRYAVRYFDPSQSKVLDDQVEALSQDEAKARWAEMTTARSTVCDGTVPTSMPVLLSIAPSRMTIVARANRVGTSADFNVEWWCRELRTLLKAGMTVVEALETLHAQPTSGQCASVHAGLLRSLREGRPLSKAMHASGVFPHVLIASVTASERTSALVSALDDYLRYAGLLAHLRKQVVSAAIYPVVVICLGGLVALFLLLYVVPRFSRMYTDFRGGVSFVTSVLIALSRLLHDHLDLVLLGLAGLAAASILAWRKGWIRQATIALVVSIPPLKHQWNNFRLAKLYQSLALMLRGGFTLDEALSVCEGLDLGGNVGSALPRARQALVQGHAVSQAFSAAGLTDVVTQRLLAVGERTGSFDAILQTIADRHAEAFTTFVERTARIVEPLLLLIVALIVGGIVVVMYMPIFDIAKGVT
jgi:general secretion pathway protein F